MKFSTKLTVLFSAIILIIGAISSYLVYSSDLKKLEEQINKKTEERAFYTMDKLDRMLFERRADIKALAAELILRSRTSTPKQVTETLKKYQDRYKAYTSLSFFNLNRIVIADTIENNIGKQHQFTEYWPGIAEGKDFVMLISPSELQKTNVFYFASIVKDKNGFPFGVVVARMPVEILYDIVNQIGVYKAEEAFEIDLLDRNGLILFSNQNPEGILKEISYDWESIKGFTAGKKIGSVRHLHLGIEEFTTFAREQGYLDFKGNDWTLVLCLPTRVAFASAIELRNKLIIIFLTASVIASFLIYFFSHTISRPIVKLSNAALEIGKGNLDVKVEVTSNDEIGKLSESFNQMVTNLKAYEEKILAHSSELEKKVEKRTADLRTANEQIKKLNEELEQKVIDRTAQLEASVKELEGFTYSVAHDLRAPFRHIIGFTRLLQEKASQSLDEESMHYLNVILNSAKQMAELQDDILDFVRIGRTKMSKSEVSADELVREAIDIMRKEAEGRDIVWEVDHLPEVYGDIDMLKAVFVNLISNALKFTRPRQQAIIEIGCNSGEEEEVFYVRDNGVGFDMQYVNKLFGVFHRLHHPDEFEGIGIGLANVRRIIERHGGRIWAEGKVNKGATFYFTFPKKLPTANTAQLSVSHL